MTDTAIKDLLNSSGDPSEITLRYNGVTFGPLVKFTIESQPEYDPTRRVMVYEKYTLRVVSWEHASTVSQMDSTIEDRREKLQTPGGKLEIDQVGFGHINTGSQTPDLAWGPHPGPAKWTMLGGGVMWQLEWSCEFRINHCSPSSGAIRAGASPLSFFAYDVTYSHDELGFKTRVIRATLKIPQVQNNHQVRDIPENYTRRLQVPVPNGYERVRNDHSSNAVQDELTFTIIDRQRRTEPFPPDIALADMRIAIGSQNALTNVILTFSITGTMETLPGFPKALAQIRFFQMAFARLGILRSSVKGAIIPMRIEMDHRPFDRRSSFNFLFNVTGSRPEDILNPKVLYDPLPIDWTWDAWVNARNSKGNSLLGFWGNDGQAPLATSTPNLIDQCNRAGVINLVSAGKGYPLGDTSSENVPSAYFTCKDVKPGDSWLLYETAVEYSRNERLSVNKRDVYLNIPFLDRSLNFSSTALPTLGLAYKSPDDSVSRRGAPEQLLVIKGKALRVKFPIDVPMYKSVEGIELAFVAQKIAPQQGPAIFGCRTYYTKWIQVYRPMSYVSDKVKAMPHPNLEKVQ